MSDLRREASSACTRSCDRGSTRRWPRTTAVTRRRRCISSRACGFPRSGFSPRGTPTRSRRSSTSEITNAVRVVHGDATIAPRRGQRERALPDRRVAVAAGVVAGCGVGPASGRRHRRDQRRGAATRRAVHPVDARRHADGELDRGAARSPRDAGGPAGLEPPDHVHELAHGRPAAAPDGAAVRDRGPDQRRREARAGDRAVAGRVLRLLPRVSVLPGLPALRVRGRAAQPVRRATCASSASTTPGRR